MNARLWPAVGLGLAFAASAAGAESNAEGRWLGVVELPGRNLTLALRVQPTPEGVSAILSIPESKLIQFPAPKARFTDGRLSVEVPPKWGLAMFRDIGLPPEEQVIRYEGAVGGDAIVGKLQIAFASFPLTLRRLRPDALPYSQEEVTFHNGDVTLAGTLYLPKGPGRHPVLLFSHGSGEPTRDSNAYEADRLARSGIAALVYDKRGEGSSTGANWRVATFDELAGDLEAGLHFLRGRADIDPLRIGLFGLSQGTWLIGMVAERSPDVGFLVFVSGSGIPVWEQEISRVRSMMKVYGFGEEDIAEAEAYQRLKFQVARTGLDWAQLAARTDALKARPARWFEDFAGEFASLSSARFWWLAAFRHDPAQALEKISVPVLALFGEKDPVFPVPTVIERMKAHLSRAHNASTRFVVFPGAEHALMVPQAYGGRSLRRVVTPEFPAVMIHWIDETVVARR